DIGRQEHVLSDAARIETAQLDRLAQFPEERRPGTRKLWRDEEEELVDQARLHERGRESGPALEQQRLHSFLGKATKLFLERAGAQLQVHALRQRPAAEDKSPRLPCSTDVTGRECRVVGPCGS